VPTSYNQIAGRGLERLAALSDGLFAIAMTIIVLEIRVPSHAAVVSEGELRAALLHLLPRVATYLMSFLTLGIFWVGQQTQLQQLDHTDRHYTWIQLGFLAGVSLMPFSTGLLAEFTRFRTALLLYWLNVLLLGTMLYLAWRCSERGGLVQEGTPPEVGGLIRQRVVVAQTLYAIGAALCVVNTYWSIGFILLVQLNYAIAPRIPGLSRLTS
jgi:uncharacterized membrane protein